MPLWLAVPAIFVVSRRPSAPQLVLRPDLMSVVGVPTSVLWISALAAALYFGALCTVFRAEWSAFAKQFKGVASHRNGAGFPLLLVPFAGIGVWALFSWTNRAWASAPLEIQRSRVLGIYLNKKTRYIELRDWRAPQKLLYLPYDAEWLRQFPPQSAIEVQTQPGFWGYELLHGIRHVSSNEK